MKHVARSQDSSMIDWREALLSEAFLYGVDYVNENLLADCSLKLGGVILNSFNSQQMTIKQVLSVVPG